MFGLTADEVTDSKSQGYRPRDFYESNPDLKEAIDLIASGFFSGETGICFDLWSTNLLYDDPYLLLADYASYVECQDE